MVGVALVGCAHVHAPDWVEVLRGRARVLRVWDRDRRRAERYAAAFGAAVGEAAKAWSEEGVDVVVVGSETRDHEEHVLGAADAGKHLFVEKPLGPDGHSARTMARTVASARDRDEALFQTGYFLRGRPHNRLLKRMVSAGVFGRLTRLRACFSHGGALAGWFDGEYAWMADPARAGYGAFGDEGAHALGLLLWLADEEASAVGATLGSVGRLGAAYPSSLSAFSQPASPNASCSANSFGCPVP